MDEVAIDIEQAGAVRLLVDQMIVPDLVMQGARLGHFFVLSGNSIAALSSGSGSCGEVVSARVNGGILQPDAFRRQGGYSAVESFRGAARDHAGSCARSHPTPALP
jgi:hypothetical protein